MRTASTVIRIRLGTGHIFTGHRPLVSFASIVFLRSLSSDSGVLRSSILLGMEKVREVEYGYERLTHQDDDDDSHSSHQQSPFHFVVKSARKSTQN
jgi:hypothetical protein